MSPLQRAPPFPSHPAALTSDSSWPAAWLVFLATFFINPLPILRRSSRWWLLRVLFRVLTPGISRVEVGFQTFPTGT